MLGHIAQLSVGFYQARGCPWCGVPTMLKGQYSIDLWIAWTFVLTNFMKVAGVKKKRKFSKRLQIGRPPNCLCIHLNRTRWLPDGTMFKNNTHVTFPLSLDAGWLLRRPPSGIGRVKYKLVAAVEHMGGPFSGHYITYRRCGPTHRQWVYTSDTSVYASTTEDVLKCKAYMLFYCRTDCVSMSNSTQGFRSLQI